MERVTVSTTHIPSLQISSAIVNSTFHFRNFPTREDMELVPRSANVSQTLAARVINPLSCRSIMDKLTRRDDDHGPGSGMVLIISKFR